MKTSCDASFRSASRTPARARTRQTKSACSSKIARTLIVDVVPGIVPFAAAKNSSKGRTHADLGSAADHGLFPDRVGAAAHEGLAAQDGHDARDGRVDPKSAGDRERQGRPALDGDPWMASDLDRREI